jgi:murein hydrolase activator
MNGFSDWLLVTRCWLLVAGSGMFSFRLRQIFSLTFSLILCFAAIGSVSGQTKKDLETKRKKLETEIKEINKELGRTSKNRQATYDHYVALQSQIKRREELISTISNEVSELDDIVSRNTSVIAALTNDMKERQLEYGRLMRGALRFKTLSNPFLYILSANSLNQAYRRWVFLRKYDKYRSMQADAIQFTRMMLTRKTLQIEESKHEKTELLQEESVNKTAISSEMVEQNASLKNLMSDEQRLKKDLEEKKRAQIALDNAIENIIREEVRKAAEARAERDRKAKERAERAKEEAENNANTGTTTEAKPKKRREDRKEERPSEPEAKINAEDATSRAFLDIKGKHAWPVSGGFVARPFGEVSHPVYKEIKIQNNGIDIRTDVNAAVSAIYGGEVVGVTFVPGHDYTVIVQHGNFYSVYANLAQAYVEKGRKVDKGTDLGRVSMNPLSGAAELHFEIWQHKDRLDPERWIK